MLYIFFTKFTKVIVREYISRNKKKTRNILKCFQVLKVFGAIRA